MTEARSKVAPAKSEGKRGAKAEVRPSSDPPLRDAEIRAYNSAISTADLISVKLIASRFGPRSPDGEHVERPSATLSDKVGFHRFDPDAGNSFTTFDWEVSASIEAPSIDVSIKASFLVIYQGLKGVDPTIAERLTKRIGRFASYPYFRAYVASIGGMAELNLPTLPMLREQVHAAAGAPHRETIDSKQRKGNAGSKPE